MYILIPLILSVVCSFVNPYVGLFGIFTLVEIIIILCVDINANVRIKLSHKVSAENLSRSERLKKSGKVLAAAECVLTAFFTIITAIVEIGVWMLASGSLTGDSAVMTPFSIISEENLTLSCILLVFAIAFQVIALMLAFVRRGQLKRNYTIEETN